MYSKSAKWLQQQQPKMKWGKCQSSTRSSHERGVEKPILPVVIGVRWFGISVAYGSLLIKPTQMSRVKLTNSLDWGYSWIPLSFVDLWPRPSRLRHSGDSHRCTCCQVLRWKLQTWSPSPSSRRPIGFWSGYTVSWSLKDRAWHVPIRWLSVSEGESQNQQVDDDILQVKVGDGRTSLNCVDNVLSSFCRVSWWDKAWTRFLSTSENKSSSLRENSSDPPDAAGNTRDVVSPNMFVRCALTAGKRSAVCRLPIKARISSIRAWASLVWCGEKRREIGKPHWGSSSFVLLTRGAFGAPWGIRWVLSGEEGRECGSSWSELREFDRRWLSTSTLIFFTTRLDTSIYYVVKFKNERQVEKKSHILFCRHSQLRHLF